MARRVSFALVAVFALLLALVVGVRAQSLTFSNTPLVRPDGSSEPAISIDAAGTMAISGLSWLQFGTNYWSGAFGSTPAFVGVLDAGLQQPGRRVFGGGDADVDLGSTGTLHASTLIFLANKTLRAFQLGVSAITCRSGTTALSDCTKQIIDTAGADRQWITSDGSTVYISYHDAGNSSLIHVQRSDDDGMTWKKVGDPIVGQDGATGGATFNNTQGPIVADPLTHNVYDVYAAGEPGIQKATSATFNNIYVSRSTDLGKSWTAVRVFHAPLFTALNNVFPALAVDAVTGDVYAAWTDGHGIALSRSADQGQTWSDPARVDDGSTATTTLFPWISARSGVVDVVFYGTPASTNTDASAVWNVYLSQSTGGGAFAQSRVSNTPNHVGVICTGGTSCAPGTRNLLDLFEVAIDPSSGRAGVIYTDDTLTQSSGAPLPQIVLATQQ